MKKLLVAIALVLGAASVNAQDVGQVWVGGSVGFWSTKTSVGDFETSGTSYRILPEIGMVMNENFCVRVAELLAGAIPME